jgi:predicted nucleotidyltransferase
MQNLVFDKLSKDLSWVKDRTIFLTVHGSIAYGLNTPESDIDFRGTCIPTKEYFFGFNKRFEQVEIKDPDSTIFELRKFFNLLSQCNPNCIELLFTDEEFHYVKTDAGRKLLDNRDKFLSKYVKERYIGYAKAQAHRIKNHKIYVDSPVLNPPTREEFGLTEKLSINEDQYNAVKSLIQKKIETWTPDFEPFSESQKIYLKGKVADILSEMKITSNDAWMAAARTLGYNENFIAILNKEKAYQAKMAAYLGYVESTQKRNKKRAELEKKCGYDSKHASALIRLLKLGKEILLTGKVNVKRVDDREELLSIKRGDWKYEDLIAYADKLEKEVEESYHVSPLKSQPDIVYLDNLCSEIIESFL